MNLKRLILRNIIKLFKVVDKDIILKALRYKQHVMYKGTTIRL